MPAQIKESDWKTFRKLHSVALERFCRRVLVEIERINSDYAKSSHQRYLDIFDLIQRRNREIGSFRRLPTVNGGDPASEDSGS
jgi:hypothetical protein